MSQMIVIRKLDITVAPVVVDGVLEEAYITVHSLGRVGPSVAGQGLSRLRWAKPLTVRTGK